MRKVLQAASILLAASSLRAEVLVYAGGQANRGEHIFELGSIYPDITGYSGGSRLTFPRDMNLYGGGIIASLSHFQADLSFYTTGWQINPGTGHDEDFFTFRTSKEQGAKISIQDGVLHDTAYTFSGTRNWGDAHTRTSLSEYTTGVSLRYYFEKPEGYLAPGPYLVGGLRYSYKKYLLYDVVQFIDSRPLFYAPIGIGLSYSLSGIELPLGAGYGFRILDSFVFDPSFQILVGDEKSRDFHIQRGINFLTHSQGAGFLLSMDFIYKFSESFYMKAGFYGHRLYSEGAIHTTGANILYNLAPPQKAYVNTKESGFSLSLVRAIF